MTSSWQRNAGAVRRFARLMRLGAWLQSLPARLVPAPVRLVQIGSAFWQSRALHVAARLDIATVLGDGELGAEAIAARAGGHPDAVARLMRFLAAMGVFEETGPATFRNNRVSACLRADHPQSVRAMVLIHNSEAMSRPWYEQLERGVREGTPPFVLAHGQELFAWLDGHAEMNALFSQAMDSVEALAGTSFATDFDRVVDVGGARGHWAAHPAAGVDRLRFEAGDVLASVPAAQGPRDAHLLSAVRHGFDDGTAADLAGASFDMQMFMGTRGRERTLAQWRALFERGGVELEEVVGLRSFGSLLVLRSA